jgi:hypothetical protein
VVVIAMMAMSTLRGPGEEAAWVTVALERGQWRTLQP